MSTPPLLETAAFNFPTACFGAHQDTLSEMKRIVKAARRHDSLRTLVGELELVHFRHLGNTMLLDEGVFMGSQREQLWRPYTFAQALVESSGEAAFRPDVSRVDHPSVIEQAIRESNEHFWMALGMMGQFDGLNAVLRHLSRQLYQDAFGAFVKWIPELLAAADSISDTTAFAWTLPYPFWSRGLISAAYLCGWRLPADRLRGEFAGDWCRAMIDSGLIEQVGGRFEVTREFKKQTRSY